MKTCLVGEKLNYSLSSKIHQLLGDFSYELIELKEDELKSFFESKKYDGFNVTIPYKESVIKYLDFVDETAKKVGAVNTVVLKNNKYFGYNTDVYGLIKTLKDNSISLKDKNVLILGSGGASKACRVVVENNLGEAIIVSRSGKTNYSTMYNLDANVIINATPIGNINNIGSNVNLAKFKNLEAVVDLVYNPLQSKIIQDAKALNIKAVNGLSMLINQAIKANELFFSRESQANSIEIENQLIKEQMNVVLIGMSGVGKTTIGKELASKLGYEFFDSDELVEEKYGKITDIFTKYGESKFREFEKEIIKEISLKNNCVISVGGGAILDEENALYLKSNGRIVLINRDLDKIDISNRPLVKNRDELKSLYEKRREVYFTNADIIVNNNEGIIDAVNRIKESL